MPIVVDSFPCWMFLLDVLFRLLISLILSPCAPRIWHMRCFGTWIASLWFSGLLMYASPLASPLAHHVLHHLFALMGFAFPLFGLQFLFYPSPEGGSHHLGGGGGGTSTLPSPGQGLVLFYSTCHRFRSVVSSLRVFSTGGGGGGLARL